MWGFSSLLKKNESVIVMNIVNDFSKVTIPLLVLVISVGFVPSALAFHSPDVIGNPPAGPTAGTTGDTYSFKSSLTPAATDCPSLDPNNNNLPFPIGSCPDIVQIFSERTLVAIDRGGDVLSVPTTSVAACSAAFPGSGVPPDGFFGHEANEPLFVLMTKGIGGAVIGPNPVIVSHEHLDIFNTESQIQMDSAFGSGDDADTDDNVGPHVGCPLCVAANGNLFPHDALDEFVWREIDNTGALTSNPDTTATAGFYVNILCGCISGDDDCDDPGDSATVQNDIFEITADVGGSVLGINPVSALVAGAFTGNYWILPILAVFGSLTSIAVIVREKFN